MEEQLRLSLVRDEGPKDGEPVGARPARPADTNRPKTLDEFGDVLTVEEAAQVLRISRASAYELARRWRSQNPSGLPVIQLGRFLRVPKSALEQVLARPGELYATLVPADDGD
jgi:excisionase family DNA binding protein